MQGGRDNHGCASWPAACGLQLHGGGNPCQLFCCSPTPTIPPPQDPAGQLAQLVALEHLTGVTLVDRVRLPRRFPWFPLLRGSGAACSNAADSGSGRGVRQRGPGLQSSLGRQPRRHRPRPAAPLTTAPAPPPAPGAGARGAAGAQGAVRRGRGARAAHAGLVRALWRGCCRAALRCFLLGFARLRCLLLARLRQCCCAWHPARPRPALPSRPGCPPSDLITPPSPSAPQVPQGRRRQRAGGARRCRRQGARLACPGGWARSRRRRPCRQLGLHELGRHRFSAPAWQPSARRCAVPAVSRSLARRHPPAAIGAGTASPAGARGGPPLHRVAGAGHRVGERG